MASPTTPTRRDLCAQAALQALMQAHPNLLVVADLDDDPEGFHERCETAARAAYAIADVMEGVADGS